MITCCYFSFLLSICWHCNVLYLNIYCLFDCRVHIRFHEDVFEKYERERRKKLLDLRRHGGHLLTSSSHSRTDPSPAKTGMATAAALRTRGGSPKNTITTSSSSSSSSSAHVKSPTAHHNTSSNKSPAKSSNASNSMRGGSSKSKSSRKSVPIRQTGRHRRYSQWLERHMKPASPKSPAAHFADFLLKNSV